MASELWANDAGVAKKFKELWMNNSGSPLKLKELWVNDNGTARCIFRGETISLAAIRITASSQSPTNGESIYQLGSDGIARGFNLFTLVHQSSWLTPQGNQTAYECFSTVQTGSFSSGTFGAWLPLGTTNQNWSLVRATLGTSLASMLLQIRRIGDPTVLGSAVIELQASKESAS